MRFLSEEAAINQFITNFNNINTKTVVNHISSNYGSKEDFRSLISLAFLWDNTPEGFNYWSKLSCKWRLYFNSKIIDKACQEKEEKTAYNSLW
jgi:hypothetical protein